MLQLADKYQENKQSKYWMKSFCCLCAMTNVQVWNATKIEKVHLAD